MTSSQRALAGVLLLTFGVAARPGKPPSSSEGSPIFEPRAAEDVDAVGLWQDMANWYIDNQMPGEAMSMVARLRAAGEESVELDLIQGRALLAQGMPEEALHVLEQVAKDMPTDPRPHRALGVAYSDLQRFDEAVSQLEKAVSLDPNDAATLNNLGFLELSLGRCTTAVEHLEHVIALDGTSSRYRNNLAFALVCVGEAQRALSLFRSTGFEADARYNMGVAYERLDKLPPAIAQYQAALEADSEHKRAQEALTRLQAPMTSQGTEIQP